MTQSPPKPKAGLLDIAPYIGGKSKIAGRNDTIKLSSNENAFGCAPEAMSAFETARSSLFRYPDGHANDLRDAVATHHGLEPERLIFGNGSDEVFALLNQTYLEVDDVVLTGEYGFLAYQISARACQAEVRQVPEPNWCLEVDRLLEAVDARTRIVYVSNPSNPTGSWLSHDEIARLHAGLPSDVILVIDEAYAEFVDAPDWQSAFDLARQADNIIVTRTFSKIYGLAGLRVGFGYAPEAVVAAVDRIRLPFNINIPAQLAAIAALKAQDHVARSKAHVTSWRPRLIQQIRGLGLKVSASQGNFVLIDFGSEARCVAANSHLMDHGLIVRHVVNYGLAQALRVTIGTDEEMAIFLEAMSKFSLRHELLAHPLHR